MSIVEGKNDFEIKKVHHSIDDDNNMTTTTTKATTASTTANRREGEASEDVEHVVVTKIEQPQSSPIRMINPANTMRSEILRKIIYTQQPSFKSVADIITGDSGPSITRQMTPASSSRRKSKRNKSKSRTKSPRILDTARRHDIKRKVSQDEQLKSIMNILAGSQNDEVAPSTDDLDVYDDDDDEINRHRTIEAMLRAKSQENLRSRSPNRFSMTYDSSKVLMPSNAFSKIKMPTNLTESEEDTLSTKKKKKKKSKLINGKKKTKKKKVKAKIPTRSSLSKRLKALSKRVRKTVVRSDSLEERPEWNSSTSLFNFSIQTHRGPQPNKPYGMKRNSTSSSKLKSTNSSSKLKNMSPNNSGSKLDKMTPTNSGVLSSERSSMDSENELSASNDIDDEDNGFDADITVGFHAQLFRCKMPPVRCMRLVGDHMWVANRNGGILAFNVHTLQHVFSVSPGNTNKKRVFQIQSICPQRGRVWLGDQEGVIYAFNNDGELLFRHKAHNGIIHDIDGTHAWSLRTDDVDIFNLPTSRSLRHSIWSVSDGFSIIRHDPRNGAEVVKVQAHGAITAMCVVHLQQADARETPSNSARINLIPEQVNLWTVINGSICIFDQRGRVAARLRQQTSSIVEETKATSKNRVKQKAKYSKVLSIAVIGQTVWSGGADGSIDIWSIEERKLIKSWHAHIQGITAICAVGISGKGVAEVWTATGNDSHIGVWSSHGEHYGTISLSRGCPATIQATAQQVWIGLKKPGGIAVIEAWKGWRTEEREKFESVKNARRDAIEGPFGESKVKITFASSIY